MDKKQTLEALKKLNSLMEDFLDMMEIDSADEEGGKEQPKKEEK
jgi:hypothetical protein